MSRSELIHKEIANALASYTLATRSYTILDRLANAISIDAVTKAIYELGRSLDVIIRNQKEDQAILYSNENKITIRGRWGDGIATFTIYGRLPNEYNYSSFLEEASKDIMVVRETAAYASAIIASQASRAQTRTGEASKESSTNER